MNVILEQIQKVGNKTKLIFSVLLENSNSPSRRTYYIAGNERILATAKDEKDAKGMLNNGESLRIITIEGTNIILEDSQIDTVRGIKF